MIEKNYRIYCAMNNIPVEEGLAEGAEDDDDMAVDDDNGGVAGKNSDEWGGIMEVDDDNDDDDTPEFFKEQKTTQPFKTPSRRKKTKLGEIIKEKVRKVLEDDTELADQRASKCDENDFLRLLFAFNQEGIHFA
jgi:18S rRNA (adenine1779-N6/adenine1780-N6)-dimethyltransferase